MTEPAAAGQAPQGQQMQVQVRDQDAKTVYSNMVRIFGGPNAEELILDFTVMTPSAQQAETMVMEVNTRVAMNYFAAKRLALALSQAVQRYEQQFGPIELDPRRRFKQGT